MSLDHFHWLKLVFWLHSKGSATHPAYGRWYKDSGSRLETSTVIASSKFFRILIAAFLAPCCNAELNYHDFHIGLVHVIRPDGSKCQKAGNISAGDEDAGESWELTWAWEPSLAFEPERSLSAGPAWLWALTFTNSSARTELMRSLRYL